MFKKSFISYTCYDCVFYSLCLPRSLRKEDLIQFEKIIKKQRDIKRHEYLFKMDESFEKLYVVRAGSFKSYTINANGDEQIISFNLPAELCGLDGIQSNKHCISMKALENSSVCELAFKELLTLAGKIPTLQHQLFHILSLNFTMQLQVNINNNAETRLASFLLNISRRLAESGLSAYNFELSMTREEIGNYLGLASETISRLFTRFENKGVLSIRNRHIYLNDLYFLQILSCK